MRQLCSFLFWSCGASAQDGAGIQPQLNITTSSRCDELVDEPEQWSEKCPNMSNHVKFVLGAAELLQEESAHKVKMWKCEQATPSKSYFTGHPLAVQAPNSSSKKKSTRNSSLDAQWSLCRSKQIQTGNGDPFYGWLPLWKPGFLITTLWAEEDALCCKVSFFHLLM